jgi:putative transposase
VKGRKRHLLVDTLGLVLRVLVHPAHIPDQLGGQWLLEPSQDVTAAFPRLQQVWADSGYRDRFRRWVDERLGWRVHVVLRPSHPRGVRADQDLPPVPRGFQVLPRRWVVERTFAWLGRWRRTSKDYEYLPTTSACVVELAMICLMLRRLAQPQA